jgi:hypothetical protein
MSQRFDLGAFMAAASAQLQELLRAGVIPAERLSHAPLVWPPAQLHKSDLARLRVALTRVAFEHLRATMPPTTAAEQFVEVARTAEVLAEHALRRGVAAAGYGDAVGKQRVRERAILTELQRLIDAGVTDRDELFLRAGVPRRTGFRYLHKLGRG